MPKRTRRKKSEKTKLKEKPDGVVRKLVRKRDKNRCQRCREYVTGRKAHTSHVKTKGAYKSLRWDLDNVKLLCFRCHRHWWHKEPSDAWEWFQLEFPYRADYLLSKGKEVIPGFDSVANLKELLEELKNDL